MANYSGYPQVDYTNDLKLMAGDPSRSEFVRVSGQSLFDYLNENLDQFDEALLGFTTTDVAVNEDLPVGKIIYTTGGSVVDDGNGGPFLVVAAGEGDIPMFNGNELLRLPFGSLAGSDASAALVTDYTGTSTVDDALNKRTLYIDTLANMKLLAAPAGTNIRLIQDGRSGEFIVIAGAIPVSDPEEGVYVPVAGGAYAKRIYSGEINVKWFGAIGDGATINTTAIRAAVVFAEATGNAVFFPEGSYFIDGEIGLIATGTHLYGLGKWSTEIVQTNLTEDTFDVSAMFCSISGLTLRSSGTPTAGAAIRSSGGGAQYNNILIRSCWDGIVFTGGGGQKAQDLDILDYENTAITVTDTNDIYVSSFLFNAGNTTRGRLGGIRLTDKVEAFIVTDGDILLGKYSMTMDAAVFGVGTRPAYNNFTNVFFDSAEQPTQVNDCVETEFLSCWFSGGRSGSGLAGVEVANSQAIRFTNTKFFNNGAQGILVFPSSSDITLTACSAESNSVTAGDGVAHGIQFGDNTQQFQVIGCKSSNGLHPGVQGYGIAIGAGCNDFSIRDNNLIGNATGSILDGTSASTRKTIHGNLGYVTSNEGASSIAVGQTVTVVTHGLAATPRAADIKVSMTTAPQNSGVNAIYITAITATDFQIAANAAVSGSALGVCWSARIKGA